MLGRLVELSAESLPVIYSEQPYLSVGMARPLQWEPRTTPELGPTADR